MRLLDTETLEIVDAPAGHGSPDFPWYVTLSHTWGDGEVTFQEMRDSPEIARRKTGFAKIERTCAVALENGFKYAWVDTCCIDKTSSAELSEAINSMYAWYQSSTTCYALLEDIRCAKDCRVPSPFPDGSNEDLVLGKVFSSSRWFRRGWTLQELIAPSSVVFYARDWTKIGTKHSLSSLLASFTGIDGRVLDGAHPSICSIAERMSWASRRETTRIEDSAYCLLGIFGVNMPLIYGERHRAFQRLQEEIMKTSEDYSAFLWDSRISDPWRHDLENFTDRLLKKEELFPQNPLAASPENFVENHWSFKWRHCVRDDALGKLSSQLEPISFTARGLRLNLLLWSPIPNTKVHLAYLGYQLGGKLVAVPLAQDDFSPAIFQQVGLPHSGRFFFLLEPKAKQEGRFTTVYIKVIQHEGLPSASPATGLYRAHIDIRSARYPISYCIYSNLDHRSLDILLHWHSLSKTEPQAITIKPTEVCLIRVLSRSPGVRCIIALVPGRCHIFDESPSTTDKELFSTTSDFNPNHTTKSLDVFHPRGHLLTSGPRSVKTFEIEDDGRVVGMGKIIAAWSNREGEQSTFRLAVEADI